MKDTLISIEELSDTQETLLMKPNRLITAFICIIALLLATAVIWAGIGKIDVYVTAEGLVRTNEEPSVLLTINGGKALQVNMSDGQTVSKGDVLLSFDQQPLTTQRDNNSRDIENLRQDISLLNLYRNSINDLQNYLSGDETDKGRAYGLKVESFLLQRLTALTQVDEDEKNNELLKSSAEVKLNGARDTLSQLQSQQSWLQLYRKSIENGQDLLSMDSGSSPYKANYVSLYQKYVAGLRTLETAKSQAQTNLDNVTKLYEYGAAARKDLDDAQNAVNDAGNNIKSYNQTELSSVNSQLADITASIGSAQASVQSAQQDVNTYSVTKTSPMMQIEQAKIDLLTQIDSQIQQENDNVNTLNASNASLDAQMNDSVLTAPIDGILTLNNVINEGDTVAPGTTIGMITPPNSDSFRVTLQVSNKDIAGIKLNQPVKFKFLALPYQEYGMIDGTISQISADSSVNPQTGGSFYSVEAVIENKPITSYRGDNETIKVGMAVEARIISDQKTILRWLLEKMNFA